MTVSDDVRGCVHAGDGPEDGSDAGQSPGLLAHARAIPRQALVAQQKRARNFAQLHVAGPVEAARGGWLAREAPPCPAELWSRVVPAAGEASGRGAWAVLLAARLFSAAVITGLWWLALSLATDLRAKVGLLVFVLAVVAGLVLSLAGVTGR